MLVDKFLMKMHKTKINDFKHHLKNIVVISKCANYKPFFNENNSLFEVVKNEIEKILQNNGRLTFCSFLKVKFEFELISGC